MKYTPNSKYSYPDHTKILLKPETRFVTVRDKIIWEPSKAELKLLAWLEEHISPIASYDYTFPFFAKEHWCIRECYSMDHNPEDWAWRNINYYEPKGELGIFLIINDTHEHKVIELMLSGLVQEAAPSGMERPPIKYVR